MTPAFFGIASETLSTDERDFIRDADPAGYILFARNISTRDQVRALTDSLRSLSGRDRLPILIDQEGGRVARMGPPEWPAFPRAAQFDVLYDVAPMSAIEAARANAWAIGLMLAEVGISVDCMPLIDIRQPDADAAIGDRALGSDPLRVAALGRAVLDGLAQAGIVGVVKHLPGHGRAMVDPHHALPIIAADAAALETDLRPFQRLADAPMGMVGHLLVTAWDAALPATLSPTVIGEIIRGRIGFDGLLMTDDIAMQALSGTETANGAKALAAGCDVVLHCAARLDARVAMAAALPALTAAAHRRLVAAMERAQPDRASDDIASLVAKRDQLLALR